MKKMMKTRKLLSILIERDKINDKGMPITDSDIKNVVQELKRFERQNFLLKVGGVILIVLLVGACILL